MTLAVESVGETPSNLIEPYGGPLVDLLVTDRDEYEDLRAVAAASPSFQISERAMCDLELLATGGFSPLSGFMGHRDFASVLHTMRLADGAVFPIPVTLPLDSVPGLSVGKTIALRAPANDLLAVMDVQELYEWSFEESCDLVARTRDSKHPLVTEMKRWGRVNAAGNLRVLQLPKHYDFESLRLTPRETRRRLGIMKRPNIVAFQTRNPMHRVHEELTRRAIEQVDGALLLHPAVGMTKPGDVDHYTRVRTYQALSDAYDPARFLLALLPLAMRLAGPREALWHAIIRRNYGANFLIIGRDHASPGSDSKGRAFYDPYAAQELVEKHQSETGVRVIPFREFVFLPSEGRYEEVSNVSPGTPTASISGTQVRDEYLNAGRLLPAWFTRPEVARILAQAYPPKRQQGFCIWFTGLSGSGKTTTAEVLRTLLLERGRQITLLDGDVVRTTLSSGLGFSREDRDANIRRIGFVAAEIVRHRGIVICAAVSPYRSTREEVRSLVGSDQFFEVFVDTPLEVCEQRDVKGMYAKARRGEIHGFTGIDDPYEPPLAPEITLETTSTTAEQNARRILQMIERLGFLEPREKLAPGTDS
jgi:sulfate adenylyltransferase